MIVINNKLAKEVMANALQSGRIRENSSAHAVLLQTLMALQKAFSYGKGESVMKREDNSLFKWTDAEIAAAETICWAIAYLEHTRCEDIERLLGEVARYRARYPDYPKRNWPHHE